MERRFSMISRETFDREIPTLAVYIYIYCACNRCVKRAGCVGKGQSGNAEDRTMDNVHIKKARRRLTTRVAIRVSRPL